MPSCDDNWAGWKWIDPVAIQFIRSADWGMRWMWIESGSSADRPYLYQTGSSLPDRIWLSCGCTWILGHVTSFSGAYMNTFSVKDKYFFLSFRLPFPPKWWKHIPKTETYEYRDLRGDFENRASENAQKHSCKRWKQILEWIRRFMSADTHVINWPSCNTLIGMDHTQTILLKLVMVQPHPQSKQILASCRLPLVWEASHLTHIKSVHVEPLLCKNHVGTVE